MRTAPVTNQSRMGTRKSGTTTRSTSAEFETDSFEKLLQAEMTPVAAAGSSVLDSLLDTLQEREQDLENHPSLANFLRYREQVRRTAGYLMKEAFRSRSFQDRKQRNYELVEEINRELAAMYRNLTGRNPETLFILRTMSAIRGLLLDELR